MNPENFESSAYEAIAVHASGPKTPGCAPDPLCFLDLLNDLLELEEKPVAVSVQASDCDSFESGMHVIWVQGHFLPDSYPVWFKRLLNARQNTPEFEMLAKQGVNL